MIRLFHYSVLFCYLRLTISSPTGRQPVLGMNVFCDSLFTLSGGRGYWQDYTRALEEVMHCGLQEG